MADTILPYIVAINPELIQEILNDAIRITPKLETL